MLDQNRRKQWELQKAAFDARISEMKSGDPKTRDGESRDNNNTRDGTDTVIPNEAPEHQKSEMMWFQSENEEHTKDMHQSSRDHQVKSDDQSNHVTISKNPSVSQQPETPELPPKLKFMLDMMEKNGKLTPEKKAFFMKMIAKKRAQSLQESEVASKAESTLETVGSSVDERNKELEKEATKNALAELISKRRLQANSAPVSALLTTAKPPPQTTMTPATNLNAKALLLQRLAAKKQSETDSSSKLSSSKLEVVTPSPVEPMNPKAAFLSKIKANYSPTKMPVTVNDKNSNDLKDSKSAFMAKLSRNAAFGVAASSVTVNPSMTTVVSLAKTTTKLKLQSTIETTSSTDLDPRAAFFARFNKQTTTAVPLTVKTSMETTPDPRAAFFARFNKPTTTALPLQVKSTPETASDPRSAFLAKIKARTNESLSVAAPSTIPEKELTPEEKSHLAKKEFFKRKMAKKAAAAATAAKTPMTATKPPTSIIPPKPSGPPASFLANMSPEKREFFMKMMAKKKANAQSTQAVIPPPPKPMSVVNNGPTLMERLRAKMMSQASTVQLSTTATPITKSFTENNEVHDVNSRNLLLQKLAERKMLEMKQESKPTSSPTSSPTTMRASSVSPMQSKKPNSRIERRERKQRRKQSNQLNPTTGSTPEAEVTIGTIAELPVIDAVPLQVKSTSEKASDPRAAFLAKIKAKNDESISLAAPSTAEENIADDHAAEKMDPRKAFMLKMMNKSSKTLPNSTKQAPLQPAVNPSSNIPKVNENVSSNPESIDAKKAFFQRMMAAKSQSQPGIPTPSTESTQSDLKSSLMNKLNSMRAESEPSESPVDSPPPSADSSTGISDDKKAFFMKMLAKKRGRRAANRHQRRHRREHLYWRPIMTHEILNGS